MARYNMSSEEEYEYVFDSTVENQRLVGQNQAIKLAMGKLVLTPLQVSQKNLRVLDVGTSDGYWLSEVLPTLAHPETCELIGTDITPERFPATPPRWLILTVQNSLGPWPDPFLQSFDLVHQRLVLLGTGTQSRECVLALTSLVKPGGWIQLVDLEDGSTEPNGPQMRRFERLFREVAVGMGSDLSFQGGAMEDWIRGEGFVRVGTMLAPLCLGAQCPDLGVREQSVQVYCVTEARFLQACKGFPGGVKCMSEEASESYIPQLAEELRTKGGYFPLRVIWGQRPE